MTSWAYRATPTGTSYAETVAFITEHGFVWRPLFKATEQRSKAGLPPTYSHLGAIDPGCDELFVYFADGAQTRLVGAFAFAPPRSARPPAHPAGAAPAVVQVPETDPLDASLRLAGYAPDSHLGVFTGFDVVPLTNGLTPPGPPAFAGQYSIGTFSDGPGQDVTSLPPEPMRLPACSPVSVGRCYGVDWSGAARAGDKVWVAELDPAERRVLSVRRPWQGRSAADTVGGVARWLETVSDAWVAFDFPFGIAACDRAVLFPGLPDDPRAWGTALARSFPTVLAFREDVASRDLIGVNRRAADRGAPFSPLLLQLIYQTYWGLRLLGQLPSSVAVLPWQHAATATTRVLETCPAVVLRALGQSNEGYKLARGAETIRAALLDRVLDHPAIGWTCPDEVRQQVIADREGDALDAVLAGLAAWSASAIDHSAIASLPHRLDEGHIYA